MDVSVVIPSVNSPLLATTLDSLRNQKTDCSYEVLVVGRDDAVQFRDFAHVRFIDAGEVLSAGANRNIGIKEAKGRFILFTDADCRVAPDWIQLLTTRMKEGYRMVGGAFTFPRGNYWVSSDNMAILHNLSPETQGGEVDIRVGGGNMGVWLENLLELGGFDETFRGGQDNDIAIKLLKAGHKIYFEPKAIVEHLPQEGSLRWLCRHASIYGRAAVALIERHPAYYGWDRIRRLWRLRWLFRLWSPVRALLQSLAVFRGNPSWLRHLHTLPGIWLFYLVRRIAMARAMGSLLNLKEEHTDG